MVVHSQLSNKMLIQYTRVYTLEQDRHDHRIRHTFYKQNHLIRHAFHKQDHVATASIPARQDKEDISLVVHFTTSFNYPNRMLI